MILGHHVEIVVGCDREELEEIVEHLAVLGGNANARDDIRMGLQSANDGGHLDRIRARPEHAHHTQLVGHWLRCVPKDVRELAGEEERYRA